MILSCLWLLLLLPSFDSAPSGLAQDKQEDAAAGLKAEGWRAVRSLVDRGEASRSALEKAVAGGDPDVAFLAAAAL